MRKFTVLAAAFAVGLTSFAANAKDVSESASKTVAKTAEKKPDKGSRDEASAKIDKTTTASVGAKTAALDAKTDLSRKAAKSEADQPATQYGTIIAHYAESYGVPVPLAHAVIFVESNYRPDARGRAGEVGLMQIKPATARMMGYSGSTKGLYNPVVNIKYGMKYLAKAHELGGGTTCGTILKYNAGHAAKRMNPVSSAYCSKVKRHLAAGT